VWMMDTISILEAIDPVKYFAAVLRAW